MSALATATTFLFVPGDRPDRFDKARTAGADVVVIDLEDAVAADRKAAARDAIREWGSTWPADVIVRINPLGTESAEADATLLASLGATGALVAKAEDPAQLGSLHRTLNGAPVLALVETARGILRSSDIAEAPGVARLAFGHLDYASDLGIAPIGPPMTHARCGLLVASAAAGLPAPIDGVTPELDDAEAARVDALAARELGFGAKLCLHPHQVPAVAEVFAPSDAELAWARRVIAEGRDGAVRVGSEMVDAPMLRRAESIVARDSHD